MSQQIVPVPGYPSVFGNKKAEVFLYTGPATYVTGGDPIYASTFGWGGFDFINSGMLDSSGVYYLEPVFSGSGAKSVVNMKWIVAATGAEYAGGIATANLTARLFALGV